MATGSTARGVGIAEPPRRARPACDRVCPACQGPLRDGPRRLGCRGCGRLYPIVAGIPDLRLDPDGYLTIEGDRAKSRRLARLEPGIDVMGLATAYYAITEDVDRSRRHRYLTHLARAELRGQALSALLPASGRVLEVGCGSGGLLATAARQGCSIEGIDIALRWLILGRRRLSDRGLRVPLTAACAEALPYPDRTFAAVVADSVIEHLDDPSRALREWARVVRPGGRLLLWSPNRFTLGPDPHVGLFGVSWLPQVLARSYVRLRRDCRWTVHPRSAAEAARIVSECGWTAIRTTAPEVPGSLASGCVERFGLDLYRRLRATRLGRSLRQGIGPLWQLEAVRGPA